MSIYDEAIGKQNDRLATPVLEDGYHEAVIVSVIKGGILELKFGDKIEKPKSYIYLVFQFRDTFTSGQMNGSPIFLWKRLTNTLHPNGSLRSWLLDIMGDDIVIDGPSDYDQDARYKDGKVLKYGDLVGRRVRARIENENGFSGIMTATQLQTEPSFEIFYLDDFFPDVIASEIANNQPRNQNKPSVKPKPTSNMVQTFDATRSPKTGKPWVSYPLEELEKAFNYLIAKENPTENDRAYIAHIKPVIDGMKSIVDSDIGDEEDVPF